MDPIRLICLAGVVALSLVLPLSAAAVRDRPGARSRALAVGAGQAGLAVAGLWIVVATAHPGIGLALGVASCGGWGCVLHERARVV